MEPRTLSLLRPDLVREFRSKKTSSCSACSRLPAARGERIGTYTHSSSAADNGRADHTDQFQHPTLFLCGPGRCYAGDDLDK